MLKFWKKGRTTLAQDPINTPNKQLSELDHLNLSQWINNLSRKEFSDKKAELMLLTQIVDAFLELPESRLVEFLDLLELHDWQTLLHKSEIDDAVVFLGYLTEERLEEFLPHLPNSPKLRRYMQYAPNTCGRNMQTDFFTVPIELNVAETLKFIRKNAKENDLIYYVYCVTETKKLIGVASLRQLALADPEISLDDIINRDVFFAKTEDEIEEAINLVQIHDLVALPILNTSNKMVGLITIDDVVDEIQEQATADIYAQAGLQQMDSVAMKAHLSYLNRIPWLVLNLFLAWIASFVISQFEQTISEVILLASLMHIAAAVGGNTAIQTLTVVTRGLAIGEFDYVSHKKALIKEISVGLLLGSTTGLIACAIVYLWKGELIIGAILGFSMFLTSFVAAAAGATVPILLKSLGKDPAVSSGVLVTMSTDIFSFFSFLGIASFGLSYIS